MSEWKKWERNLNNVPGSIITGEKKQSDVKLKRKWNDFWFCQLFHGELCCTIFANLLLIKWWWQTSCVAVDVPGFICTVFGVVFWSNQELLFLNSAAWWVEVSNTWSARRGREVDESLNRFFFFPLWHSSYVFLRGLWVPRGCAGIHCQLSHHPHHVCGLHHLLFARLHQRGQEETGGEVSERENILLKVFTPKSHGRVL